MTIYKRKFHHTLTTRGKKRKKKPVPFPLLRSKKTKQSQTFLPPLPSPRIIRIAILVLLQHLRLLQHPLQPILEFRQLGLLDHQRLLVQVFDDEGVSRVVVDLEDYGLDRGVAFYQDSLKVWRREEGGRG